MSRLARSSAAANAARPPNDELALSRLEARLPPLLSVIAGMVDLTSFFTLGHVFTAHVTGNLVVATAAAVQGGPWNLAQALAIPVFRSKRSELGTAAAPGSFSAARRAPGFQRHHEAIRRSERTHGGHRRDDRRVRDGLPICAASPRHAARSLDRGHDRKFDEYCF